MHDDLEERLRRNLPQNKGSQTEQRKSIAQNRRAVTSDKLVSEAGILVNRPPALSGRLPHDRIRPPVPGLGARWALFFCPE